MSLYEVLDLAINSLSFGSILFFGSLFVAQSFRKPASVSLGQDDLISVEESAITATATEEQPTLQELFAQADQIIAPLPPISVDEADSQLDAQIASLLAEQSALNLVVADSRADAASLRPVAVVVKQAKKKGKASTARSVNKSVKTAALLSVQVEQAPSLQPLQLSNCKTSALRGMTYVDVSDLPFVLPKGVKTYSVRGRFQGVKVSDLHAMGVFVLP
jgi:hypothetical protein